MRAVCCLLVVLSSFQFATRGDASPITSDAAFGASTVVESFEGIAAPGDDLPVFTPFALPSGAVITQPPPRSDSFGPFIVSGGFFGLEGGSSLIPDGRAYLGQANAGLFDDGIHIVLPFDVLRVGAYFATSLPGEGTTHHGGTFSAYDANNNLLESTAINPILSTNWKTSFRGFENAAGIRSIHYDGFGGGTLRMDLLKFQAIPEPSAVAVCVISLMTACATARRLRHTKQH
jgi:hypothetical protein